MDRSADPGFSQDEQMQCLLIVWCRLGDLKRVDIMWLSFGGIINSWMYFVFPFGIY